MWGLQQPFACEGMSPRGAADHFVANVHEFPIGMLCAAHFAMSKLQDSRELLNNLRAYLTRWGSKGFDFGEYNDLDRNQAVKGSALAQNRQYLEAFLKAGYAKASLVTMRNTLRLLESHFLDKFKVNPTEKSFEDFLAFLCRRSNCMLSHLRRLVNEEKMNTCVRGLADPKDADTLHSLLQLLNEVVVPSPSPSPGEAPKEEVAKEGQDPPRAYPTYESLVRSPSSMPADDLPSAASSSDGDNAPRSALQQARNRQGKLPGTRGSTKVKTKQMRKPAAAKPPAAEAADPAKSPYRVGKFSHKGYVQVFDTDSNAWKLLVNVDYTNCSQEWKSKCHEVLDKLLAYVQNKPESTKEELRSKRNDWLQAAEHGDVASSMKRPATSSLRPKKASRKAQLKSKDDPEMPAVSPEKIRRRSNLLSSPGNIDQGDSLSFSDFGSFAWASCQKKRCLTRVGFPTGLPLFVTVAQIECWIWNSLLSAGVIKS